MNTRKSDKSINNRFLNKTTLTTAVASAIFGATSIGSSANAAQFLVASNSSDVTITNNLNTGGDTSNSTTSYLIGANRTLTFASNASVHYGSIDAYPSGDGGYDKLGAVIVAGNLTMHGNVGSSNTTGNFTINDGNILTLASNVSTFNSNNITLRDNTVLNMGNSSLGYNRGASDSLTIQGNITMEGGNSTINVGSGTTITGAIVGDGDGTGTGTLNVLGNFTTGGNIGYLNSVDEDAQSLEQINISEGNKLTVSNGNNITSTRMNINGTVTAHGNITSTVSLGTSGTLNLFTESGHDDSPRVDGTIDGFAATGGTLNINGTYTTKGIIGDVYGLSAITIDSSSDLTAQTVTLAHNVTATNIYLGNSTSGSTARNNATLATSAQIIITGNIKASGNSSAPGYLDINDDTIVIGSIGTSSASIGRVTIDSDEVLTLKGSIYSSNITLEDAAQAGGGNTTLAFNGTANTTYTANGVIDGDSAGTGLLDINSGNWTFGSAIGSNEAIAAINIADGSEMEIRNNISANETIVVNGVLDVNSAVTIKTKGLKIGTPASSSPSSIGGVLETSGTITLTSATTTTASDGGRHEFNNATIRLNGTHSSHATSATGYIDIGTNNQTVIIQGNTTIDLDLTNTVMTDGSTVVIIGRGSDADSNGTLDISGNISATAYQMYNITINNSTAFSSGSGVNLTDASLNATINYRSSSSLGFTGNTKAVYDASKTAIAADTTVFQALAGMSTDAALKNAIATMHPATGGAAAASASISGSSMGTASTRMAYTRQTGLGKGMNAGGATLDESMWVQIFGADVDQDNVGGVSGYDADGQGLAIGIDGMSEDGMTRIGIAGSFANTDVTGKDSTTKTTTDIDTTQIMAYANKVNDDGSYLEGTASFAFNDNTGTRRILVGAVDRTASSAYDSTTFGVNVEAGWPKENDGVTITPTLGMAYSSTSADAYTETGAGGMNLNVTPTDYSTFEGKAGVKVTGRSVDADGGVGRPEVRIGVTHNFGDDTADSTSTFTAGGSSFTTKGVETDSTKVDLGLGYTYTNPEGDTDISVNIDGRKSSSYIQYGGGLTVKWKF